MRASLTICICVLLGACASAGSDCRGDWYAIGQRDGRIGASMDQQAVNYGARCSAQVDQARYAEGWRAGFSSRPIPLW